MVTIGASSALKWALRAARADTLAVGVQRHTRAAEAVLGSMTREPFLNPSLPVFTALGAAR